MKNIAEILEGVKMSKLIDDVTKKDNSHRQAKEQEEN